MQMIKDAERTLMFISSAVWFYRLHADVKCSIMRILSFYCQLAFNFKAGTVFYYLTCCLSFASVYAEFRGECYMSLTTVNCELFRSISSVEQAHP